jgi:tetratricopeptide (TPR) repeat protein
LFLDVLVPPSADLPTPEFFLMTVESVPSFISSADTPAKAPSAVLLKTLLCLSLAMAFAPSLHAQTAPASSPVDAALTVDSLVAQARDAARQDRNRESADLFARAIQRAPDRRVALLQEYADQLTYSERAREAVPLYREYLGTGVQGDDRVRGLKGLGLALLWSDQPGRAAANYEALLQIQPNDQDALRNYAQSLSWSGRQRDAVAVLQPLLVAYPNDQQARMQLAQALAWMGRPDRAQGALDADPTLNRSDALRLRNELALAQSPRTLVDVQRSSQSNNLDVERSRLSHDISLQGGRATLGASLERATFEQEDGSDVVRLNRPGVYGRYRFNDALEINAEIGREKLSPRGSASQERTVYNGWLTWWASDVVRFDFSSKRSTFDNLQSLRLGLTTTEHGASVSLSPDERQRYGAQVERGIYSDGNRRNLLRLNAEYRVSGRPEVWVGLRHTRMEFSELLNNGYFNPEEFDVTQATLRLGWRPYGDRSPWDVTAFAAIGREHAKPDGSKPAYDVSLATGWRFDERTRLELRLQRFSSRTSGFSGFGRTTAGIQLDRRW